MSRKKAPNQHSLTIYLSPEMMAVVDNYMVSMGIESRAGAVVALMYAGSSSVPLDAMIGETLSQAVRGMKRSEFQALAEFYAGRANLYAGALR